MLIFISFGTEDVHYLLDCDMAILGKERKGK